jgi:Ca2+-binding EF-hand superfamily protein
MRRPTRRFRIIGIITVLATSGTLLCTAAAQKASAPRQQNNLALGEEQVRQLLPLMHADKNGMVSRQEYMKFMEAEFDRLDKEKKGELDAKKLAQSNLSATAYVGK